MESDPFRATPAELLSTVRSLDARMDEHSSWLEKIHHDNLSRAADLGNTLKQLTHILQMHEHSHRAQDDLHRDMRLTLTGIGSLAKSLTERIDQHAVLLQRLVTAVELLTTLAQKDPPSSPCGGGA
jgi:hypothetical protein